MDGDRSAYTGRMAPKGKKGTGTGCPAPGDAALESTLDALIEMDAMLAQGAADAFSDNPDALFSHGKNFFFADFNHSGLKRRYYPWDLDAVFRSTTAGIYGDVSRNRVTQTPYEQVLLNHPAFRARYNAILAALVSPGGPLSEASLHAFLNTLEPQLSPALADDPFSNESPGAAFQSLRAWISARIPNVLAEIARNGSPQTR